MLRFPTWVPVVGLVGALGTSGAALAQRGAAPKSNALHVIAVVGCVASEGNAWILTNASGPLEVPTADGQAESGSGVTFEKAKAEPPGKQRYRLINMLSDLGVAAHKAQ